MSIRITTNGNAVNEILKRVEALKSKIQNEMTAELLVECCNSIIRRANDKLQLVDIGKNIKSEISKGWYISQKSAGVVALVNSSEKAVYVEFGVGAVGAENPHDEAGNVDYDYNVPSKSKYAGKYHDEDTWRFYKSNKADIDLQQGYYEDQWRTQSGSMKIITRGSPATMFVFNAVQDFVMEREAFTIWERICAKHLR